MENNTASNFRSDLGNQPAASKDSNSMQQQSTAARIHHREMNRKVIFAIFMSSYLASSTRVYGNFRKLGESRI